MEQIQFILNNANVSSTVNPNIVVLDFLRQQEHLTGTKEGCREGDCGACTILVGELNDSEVQYKSVNSCLMPLGDANGKHIVTIEGINQQVGLNPIQHAFVEDGGTQCGFCTPGFLMSLTGYFLNNKIFSAEEAIHSVDGNICRCTGHPPIKRAISHAVDELETESNPNKKIIPEYFQSIAERLNEIQVTLKAEITIEEHHSYVVSGGTDLYVQKAFTMHSETVQKISSRKRDSTITETDSALQIPATLTVEEFRISAIIEKYFPELKEKLEMFGSTPIRNRATLGGNIVNASPIGDMTNIFLALNAELFLRFGNMTRTLPLRKFYLGYKQLDKKKNELIEFITIPKPTVNSKSNYEKVSRRQYLDIASVNSTMVFELSGKTLSNVGISAGGVSAIPLFLEKTSLYLNGKDMSESVFQEMLNIAQTEIAPISDARGSSDYKKLLLRQLLAAHILKFFPDVVRKEILA